MPAFFDYIRNITYYLLFASLVGMLAPPGRYKKFVGLVMGFILVLMVIQPLMRFTDGPIPVTEWFAGLVFLPDDNSQGVAAHYENWRYSYIQAAFEQQLRMQVEDLLRGSGISLHDVDFSYTTDFSRITGVRATVSRREEERRVPFIRIQPIQINDPYEPSADPAAIEARDLISRFYNLAPEHIYVIIYSS